MSRAVLRTALGLAVAALFGAGLRASDQTTDPIAAEKAAREIVARFDKGDPGWNVRVDALVELAKRGPAIVPVLVEALQKGSPSTREFAAQALVSTTWRRSGP